MSVATSSSPISSVAPASSSPISSVPYSSHNGLPSYHQPNNGQLLTRLHLDLRGERFIVERETLMLLPESVLLCLFPNGLVLSRPESWEGVDEEVYGVDFDPECFHYVLTFWREAQDAFYGTPTNTGLFHLQQSIPLPPVDASQGEAYQQSLASTYDPQQNPLLSKQAVIVLREELEYFAITPSAANGHIGADGKESDGPKTNMETGAANDALRQLKRDCGKALLDRKQIFTALQRNVNKENNLAEQHLIDMLCMSGFSRQDEWGYRAVEPNRCCISSIALVLLKTGIMHSESSEKRQSPTIDANQMATAQKLLLFWRKPARKCWWDGVEVEVPLSTAEGKSSTGVKTAKVWARRVWTLELSLI